MQKAWMPLPFGSSSQGRPKLIAYHAMAEFIEDDDGKIFTAFDWLKRLRLSAHALVTPSGVVIRTRRDNEGAYHAKGFNTDSLGIEFLVPGVHNYGTFLKAMKTDYLTTVAFRAGVEQTLEWRNKFAILDNVQPHSKLSPGRKHDPGEGFPDREFREAIGL